MHNNVRRVFWPAFGLFACLALVVLWLMPAEKTLGQVIKVVYLHGGLSRAGMAGLVASGLAGLLYLLWRRPAFVGWSRSLLISGWAFWVAHFVVSIPATRLTWGPWVAWGEPRVTMTLQVMAAGLVVIVVSSILGDARFTSAANLLLGVAIFLVAARTGVIRHPLDPIGQSPSATLQFVYLLLVLPLLACMALLAWRIAGGLSLQVSSSADEGAQGSVGGMK